MRSTSLKLIRHRQSFAALGTATLEHVAAILGGHAGSKAMLFGAATLVGLVRALGHSRELLAFSW